MLEGITEIILLDFLPINQECRHWLKFLGIRVSVTRFDVDDGISLLVP